MFLLIANAHATICDYDQDGFVLDDPACTPTAGQYGVRDCDDGDPYVHPAAFEIPMDGIDDNCNDWDKAVRYLSETWDSMAGWGTFTGNGTVQSHVAIMPKGLQLDPEPLPGGGSVPAAVYLNGAFLWETGYPLITMEVSSWTPPVACEVKVVGDAQQLISFTGVGYYALPFPEVGDAPFMLNDLRIRCSGAGKATIDWVIATDGGDGVHMLGGASSTLLWHTTMMPGGGATNLTLVPTSSGVYAASDVGGVAFSDATGPQWFWEPRNGGEGAGLVREQDLAVWGLAVDPDDDLRIFALTGGQDAYDNLYGGLWSSDDGGVTWDLVADESDGVAAYGRGHACADDGPARAGGKLVQYLDHAYTDGTPQESDYLIFASHGGTDVGSSTSYLLTPTEGGLHLLDSTGTVCEPFTGLPSPLPDIGALELIEQPVATDPTTEHRSLLVGFKGYYADGSDPSLYRCALAQSGGGATASVSCSSTITCTAVPGSEGLDVRDIQMDVDTDFQTAWVADAGRVPDATGSCAAAGASAVYEWSIDILSTSWDVLVDETDNLTAPDDGTHDFLASELVGLAMAPDSDSLFAFFPEGQDAQYDDTEVKMWRREVHSGGWGDPWIPMSDVDDTSREANVQGGEPAVSDQWMDDLVARASWAPAYAVDGAFIASTSCTSPYCMLVADGFGVWRVDGWDAPAPYVDTDTIWNLQLGDYPDEFQTTVVTDIAVSKNASPPFAFAAVADLGGMWLDVPASSELGLADFEATGRGELECNWDAWNTASGMTEIFEDSVWYASVHQSGRDYQGFSRWDGTSWCYEGTDLATGSWFDGSLRCRDDDTGTEWTDCGADGGDGWMDAVTGNRLSNPSDIEVFSDEVAFVAAVGNGTDEVGLYMTFDAGVTWEEVAFNPTLDGANGGPDEPGYSLPSGCTESAFFASNVRLALRPNNPADATAYNAYDSTGGTYSFDLIVSSRNTSTTTNCGLMRVTFDDTSGLTGATWAPIPLGEEEDTLGATGAYGTYGEPCESSEASISEAAWITISGSSGSPEQRILVLSTLSNEYPDFTGGLCLIDPDDYTDTQRIVDAADLPVSWRTVVEDPASADVFYLGANVDETARAACRIIASRATWWQLPDSTYADGPEDCDTWQVPGPYQLEYDVSAGTWSIALMSTSGLDNPNILTMDWGGDAGYYAVLYAGTNGSGVYHQRSPLCLDIAPYTCE